jgi:hypothetical protein
VQRIATQCHRERYAKLVSDFPNSIHRLAHLVFEYHTIRQHHAQDMNAGSRSSAPASRSKVDTCDARRWEGGCRSHNIELRGLQSCNHETLARSTNHLHNQSSWHDLHVGDALARHGHVARDVTEKHVAVGQHGCEHVEVVPGGEVNSVRHSEESGFVGKIS